MLGRIENTKWNEKLKEYFNSEEFLKLEKEVESEYSKFTIYPKKENIFKAYECVDFDDVKVVVIGQDPYHEEGQAEGLAFSVNENFKKLPPSLKNIHKEYFRDIKKNFKNGSLKRWCEKGVLLLNANLTVRKGLANSHKNIGWMNFVKYSLKKLCEEKENIVFVLWGKFAMDLVKDLDLSRQKVFYSSHPSPLSANKKCGEYPAFLGSGIFSRVNEYLKEEIFD